MEAENEDEIKDDEALGMEAENEEVKPNYILRFRNVILIFVILCSSYKIWS